MKEAATASTARRRAAPAAQPAVLVRLSEMAAGTEGSEDEFNQWYEQQMAVQLAVDGFSAARRYQVAGGQRTYMTVYECRSIGVLNALAHQPAPAARPASKQPAAQVRDTQQFACRETWSVGTGIGGSAIVVQCKPIQGREESARDFIRESFGAQRMPALVRMSLWEADVAPTAGAHWMLSMESYDAGRMALAVHAQLLGCESDKTGLLVGSWTRYQLLCARGAQS